MLANARVNENASSADNFSPLRVILPDALESFYAERGYLATIPHEERGHARLNVRSHGYIRFLPPQSSLQFDLIVGDDQLGSILVKDLSKAGIAFLYHRQIFPGERFDILIHGRSLNATAIRCRRIGPKCYETGSVINSMTFETISETAHSARS